jgi:hypothetical protein
MIQFMKNIHKYSVYVLAYSLWAICVTGGFWVLLRAREALISMIVVASLDRYEIGAREAFNTGLQVRATDIWSYLFMGIGLIIMVVIFESVFRTAALEKQVWPRFSLVLAIELGVLFLAELVIALAESAVRAFSWADLIVPLAYLIPAALFVWLWLSIRPKPSAI